MTASSVNVEVSRFKQKFCLECAEVPVAPRIVRLGVPLCYRKSWWPKCSALKWCATILYRRYSEGSNRIYWASAHKATLKEGVPNHLRFYKPVTNLKIISYSQTSENCISLAHYTDGNALHFCTKYVCVRTQEGCFTCLPVTGNAIQHMGKDHRLY